METSTGRCCSLSQGSHVKFYSAEYVIFSLMMHVKLTLRKTDNSVNDFAVFPSPMSFVNSVMSHQQLVEFCYLIPIL